MITVSDQFNTRPLKSSTNKAAQSEDNRSQFHDIFAEVRV